jgi:hypothetical protein
VQNIIVSERSLGGRVKKLTVMTDQGNIDLKKDEILRAFDAPNSLLFYVQPQSEPIAKPSGAASTQPASIPATQQVLKGFTFTGGGLGHAVGLSQAGSYRLSDIGYSAEQILNFYYPGAKLQPLVSSIVSWRDTQPTPPVTDAAQPVSGGNVGQPPDSLEDGPEILGIKLPNFKFNMLWEWLPFF